MSSAIPDPMIRITQACLLLKCSTDRIRDLVEAGKLECVRDEHGAREFRFSHLIAFLEQERRAAIREAKKCRRLMDEVERAETRARKEARQ